MTESLLGHGKGVSKDRGVASITWDAILKWEHERNNHVNMERNLFARKIYEVSR